MGHHGCGRNCFARSHDPAYGLYAASRVRFAGLQKRSPPLTPLRDNRLPTVRRTFQYQSRYWRESFVCTLDTGRLMGGPFVISDTHNFLIFGILGIILGK